MNRFICILFTLLLIGSCGFVEVSAHDLAPEVNAQEAVSMADAMRSNGKIYVVFAVVLLIQAGLFVMLWRLDRKVSKLEALG
jgi:hypothetical protein